MASENSQRWRYLLLLRLLGILGHATFFDDLGAFFLFFFGK
jgi:hypothetical protein